jgi:4-alpha-glucanotransferase
MQTHSRPPLTERGSGILLHLTSLPSLWGVGDLGHTARRFATRLGDAGQRYWQVLPLNPTTPSAGESPYYSNSSRAGNTLLISIEDLVEEGLLTASEGLPSLTPKQWQADFSTARRHKQPLLDLAAERFAAAGDSAEFRQFCAAQHDWLNDHALFTALAQHHHCGWADWPDELKFRDPDALAAARERLADGIECEKRLQYFFHRQWLRLRAHSSRQGVWLFGDIPIYVNYDSVDVWADTAVFKLDADLRPLAESGVPPDYFSATGQLWRNPVYDWDHLKSSGFHWWLGRLATQLQRLDVLRIDHFRGLVQYWEVPAGAENAIHGSWQSVPSREFFDALRLSFDPLPVVAEDLGTITPDVCAVRDEYGLPGMIVLQFAFGEDNDGNPYLPHNHSENAVAYLGTHDNNTARGWFEQELDDAAHWRLGRYVNNPGTSEEAVRALIDLLLSSRARTAIVCAQDLLALPASARMNTPGDSHGNWHWQLTPRQFEDLPLAWLAERCRAHGR